MRRTTHPVAVAVLALLLCGCGSKKPLSRADFITQGNALCKASSDKLDSVKQVQDPKLLAASIKPAEDVLGDTIAKLKGLTPPKSLAADYKTVLGNLEDAEDQFGPLIAAAKKQDLATVTAISQRIDAINVKTNPLWSRLGLNVCAQQ